MVSTTSAAAAAAHGGTGSSTRSTSVSCKSRVRVAVVALMALVALATAFGSRQNGDAGASSSTKGHGGDSFATGWFRRHDHRDAPVDSRAGGTSGGHARWQQPAPEQGAVAGVVLPRAAARSPGARDESPRWHADEGGKVAPRATAPSRLPDAAAAPPRDKDTPGDAAAAAVAAALASTTGTQQPPAAPQASRSIGSQSSSQSSESAGDTATGALPGLDLIAPPGHAVYGRGRSPVNTTGPLPRAVLEELKPAALRRIVQIVAAADGVEDGIPLMMRARRASPSTSKLCRPRPAARGATTAADSNTDAALVQEVEALGEQTIGIVAVTTKDTPLSLGNAMQSWRDSGLLRLVDERVLWGNGVGLDADSTVAHLAAEHDFALLTPHMLTPFSSYVWRSNDSFPLGAKWLSHGSARSIEGYAANSFTIGPSLAFAADMAQADYVVFLEKDFALGRSGRSSVNGGGAADVQAQRSEADVARELLHAALLLRDGVPLVRLRAIEDKGTSGFPDCCAAAPQQGGNKQTTKKQSCFSGGGDAFRTQRNWFEWYCDPIEARSNPGPGRLGECSVPRDGVAGGGSDATDAGEGHGGMPRARCFTSVDSNWSNNPMLVNRRWLFSGDLERVGLRDSSVAAVALWKDNQKNNGLFEVNMLNAWGRWKSTVCISLRGLFSHVEIDG